MLFCHSLPLDKDLLDQTSVSLLNLLPEPSANFLTLSCFNKEPCQMSQNLPFLCLIQFLSLHSCSRDLYLLMWPIFSKIPDRLFYRESPSHLMFPLSNFSSTAPKLLSTANPHLFMLYREFHQICLLDFKIPLACRPAYTLQWSKLKSTPQCFNTSHDIIFSFLLDPLWIRGSSKLEPGLVLLTHLCVPSACTLALSLCVKAPWQR